MFATPSCPEKELFVGFPSPFSSNKLKEEHLKENWFHNCWSELCFWHGRALSSWTGGRIRVISSCPFLMRSRWCRCQDTLAGQISGVAWRFPPHHLPGSEASFPDPALFRIARSLLRSPRTSDPGPDPIAKVFFLLVAIPPSVGRGLALNTKQAPRKDPKPISFTALRVTLRGDWDLGFLPRRESA